MSDKVGKRQASDMNSPGAIGSDTKKPKQTMTQSKGPWSVLCSLEELVNVVRSFNWEKKKLLEDWGLGYLLFCNTKTVRKTMCKWVIDHFDPKSRELVVHGHRIEVTPRHVEWLLGFKDGGYDIVEIPHDPSKMKKSVQHLLCMDIATMSIELRKPITNVETYQRILTLFVLTSLCSPTVDGKPKIEWMHVVAQEDKSPQWNFARFILDSTVRAIADFKDSPKPTTLGGCPLLLMAIYCEYSPRGGLDDIWKCDLPRIRDWNDLNIKRLHDAIILLPEGYKTNKLMNLIDKEKWMITGQVPTQHAQNVEKCFMLLMDKMNEMNEMNRDLNQMFKWVSHVVQIKYEHEEDSQEKERGGSSKGQEDIGSDEGDGGNVSDEEGEGRSIESDNDEGDREEEYTDEEGKTNEEDDETDVEAEEIIEGKKHKSKDEEVRGKPSAVSRTPLNEVKQGAIDDDGRMFQRKMLPVYRVVNKCNPEWKWLVDFVFHPRTEPGEVLIKSKWIDASRWELCTLFPGKCIVDTVIDLVGIRLTLSKPTHFYVPTTLRYMDVKRKRAGSKYLPSTPLIRTGYFPDDPSICEKILVPFWSAKPDHWFIAVVCMETCTTYLIDSLRQRRIGKRTKQVKQEIQKLSALLSSSGDDDRVQRFRDIASWEIKEVLTPQQDNGFECGMHVIKILEVDNMEQWTSKKYFQRVPDCLSRTNSKSREDVGIIN